MTHPRQLPRRDTPRAAFTLVELLVVISILATLASLLLPALSRSRDAGSQAGCQSNQRQLAVASMLYSLDNNNWLNPLQTAVPDSSVETTYRVILWNYVAFEPSVFDCPAEHNAVYADGITAYDASYGDFTFSLDTNWGAVYGVAGPYEKWNQSGIGVAGAHWIHIDGNPDPAAQVSSMPFGRPIPDYYEGLHRATEINAASKLIWYGDGGCGSPATWADDSWWIKSTDTGGNGSEDMAGFNRLQQQQYGCQRHNGKANYAFADGHVQLLDPNQIPCNTTECWWSLSLTYHQNQSP
jgi:prepilin-type processing-associated H-X9-DG protein/prepilin-type N-terminal cleavage/methylation domain-containing protein